MYYTIIKVLFDLTLSLQDNEDNLSELLHEFDSTKVLLHLNEIGVFVQTKEENDRLTSQIVDILTREKYCAKVIHL